MNVGMAQLTLSSLEHCFRCALSQTFNCEQGKDKVVFTSIGNTYTCANLRTVAPCTSDFQQQARTLLRNISLLPRVKRQQTWAFVFIYNLI